MPKILTVVFAFLLTLFAYHTLHTDTLAFPTMINYQGRAFDANNQFIVDGCYPVSIKIGRFSRLVIANTGSVGDYTQSGAGVEHILDNTLVLNTHPNRQCPTGQAYVANGLFNVILNLEKFNSNFMASTLPFYGVSINFNNKGWSKWQPLVEDNWVYPNTTTGSPQKDYYLASHNLGSRTNSWGLSTNHGFWAQGGLGAPVVWLIGGDYSASWLTMTAGGRGDGWYSSIDASSKAVGTVPEKARPLKLNPSGGDIEISSRLRIVPQGSNRANIRPLVQNGDILISDDSGQETRGVTIQNGGNLKIGKQLCFGTDCRSAWPGSSAAEYIISIGTQSNAPGPTFTSCSFPGDQDNGYNNGAASTFNETPVKISKWYRSHQPNNRYLNIAMAAVKHSQNGWGTACKGIKIGGVDVSSKWTGPRSGDKFSVDLNAINLTNNQQYLVEVYADVGGDTAFVLVMQEASYAYYQIR